MGMARPFVRIVCLCQDHVALVLEGAQVYLAGREDGRWPGEGVDCWRHCADHPCRRRRRSGSGRGDEENGGQSRA